MFQFSVGGTPVPQPRARISTRGGFGRAYVPSAHPIHAYRAAIASAAIAAGIKITTRSTVTLSVCCTFARPKSHFSKSGLRATAPEFVKCDVDNLLKGIMDALTGVAYTDDRQVCGGYIEKKWGATSSTTVEIS